MKTFDKFLLESSLSRVYSHTKDRNIGMITAHRGENSTEENNERNAELARHIRNAGYGYIKVKGRYVENHGTPQARNVDEDSFLVIGKKGDDKDNLKTFLLKHGEKYNQDSILHKNYNETTAKLYGTKEGSWPGKGKEHNAGEWHPSRAGEFHSVMKGSKTFTFESFIFLNSISFFSRKENLF